MQSDEDRVVATIDSIYKIIENAEDTGAAVRALALMIIAREDSATDDERAAVVDYLAEIGEDTLASDIRDEAHIPL